MRLGRGSDAASMLFVFRDVNGNVETLATRMVANISDAMLHYVAREPKRKRCAMWLTAWSTRQRTDEAANEAAPFAYTPCLRLAPMKSSRSPSSTAFVLLISTLVRRSLIRLLSST